MKTGFLIATAVVALVSAPAIAEEFISESDLQVMDTNKDGVVSKAEYLAFMDLAFDALDENNNGSLTATDFDVLLTPEEFAQMDTNRDGSVSRAEFDAQTAKDFDAADKSGTGALN